MTGFIQNQQVICLIVQISVFIRFIFSRNSVAQMPRFDADWRASPTRCFC